MCASRIIRHIEKCHLKVNYDEVKRHLWLGVELMDAMFVGSIIAFVGNTAVLITALLSLDIFLAKLMVVIFMLSNITTVVLIFALVMAKDSLRSGRIMIIADK